MREERVRRFFIFSFHEFAVAEGNEAVLGVKNHKSSTS